jgi:hypothetical protein
MRSWLLRGLILAFAMVVVRIVQGALINTWETRASGISLVLLAIYIIVVLIWGFIDGRRDANTEPDPDRRADLAMTWLLAGLIAGFVAGVVSWLIYQFYKTMYVASLFNEITTFAAFTALLIFITATIGVSAGRFVVDRRYKKEGAPPRRRDGDDSPDTDVFAAVGGGRTEQDEASGRRVQEARTEEAALHERRTREAPFDEGRTEEAPLHEGRTQEAPHREERG